MAEARREPDLVVATLSGVCLSYKLAMTELAVLTDAPSEDGVTITWKGQADPDWLVDFFESAAERVCNGRDHTLRSWLATEDGPIVYMLPSGHARDLPPREAAAAGLLRLDCVLNQPRADAEAEPGDDLPVFSVMADIDLNATERNACDSSLAIRLPIKELDYFGGKLVEMIADTTDKYFERETKIAEAARTIAAIRTEMARAISTPSFD